MDAERTSRQRPAPSVTSHGVYGETTSPTAFGVVGLNSSAGGIGVHGAAPNGNSFFADSNAQQVRTAGGWVKAMAYYTLGANTITQCFNSTLSGTAARTPPCGFVSNSPVTGSAWIDFGFQVDDRFYSVVGSTLACNGISCSMPVILACGDKDCSLAGTPNRVGIIATDISNNPADISVYVVVY